MIAETLLLSAAGGVVSAMASYATKTAIQQVDPATLADLEKTNLIAKRQEQEQQKTEANRENSSLTAKSPKTSNPDDGTQLDQAENSSLTKKELTFAEKVEAGRANPSSHTR